MVQNNARESAAPSGRTFQPPEDASLLWEALIEDSHLPVMVVSLSGIIEFANAEVTRVIGVAPEAVVGKPLSQFYMEEMVTERLGLIAEAVKAGRTITVVGMCKGRLMHSVCRPLVTPGQPTKVLMVCRLAAFSGGATEAAESPEFIRARVDDSGILEALTARELEILKLIGVGLSTADIAKQLGRSVKTVEWHRVSLGDKLGVTNRVELARIAIAAGIVGLDHPLLAGKPARPVAVHN